MASKAIKLTMKTIALLILTTLLELSLSAKENEFIRQPGQYPLDKQGSSLTITKQQPNSWTLNVTWRSGDASTGSAPQDCLRADGWFVFVEKPNRIWIFNGVDQVHLLSNSEKETGTTWGILSPSSRKVRTPFPQKLWDALPQELRAKHENIRSDSAAKSAELRIQR